MIFGVVLFISGIQMISAGLLAEVISRTYFESQNKSIYIIEKIVHFAEMIKP